MHELFSDDKYREASQKAYEFLKRMLDPSAWTVHPYYGEPYGTDYAYKLMWGGAKDIPDDAPRIDPNYLQPEQYYYPSYTGVIRGTCRLPKGEDPRNYAVAVYTISSDVRELACFCPLLAGTIVGETISCAWYTGRAVEAWEYYFHAFDRENPYMSDGAGGFVAWEPTEENPNPTRYYKTEFTSTKVVYWYWEETELATSSPCAYEIELVHKNWNITVTDEVRRLYLSTPSREGYTRPDYLGVSSSTYVDLMHFLNSESLVEDYTGWIGRDDVSLPTPELPEYITDYQVPMQSQSFRLPETDREHQGFIEYGYSRFEDYKINLYSLVLGDAEYLNSQTILWSDVIYPLPDNPPPISAAE